MSSVRLNRYVCGDVSLDALDDSVESVIIGLRTPPGSPAASVSLTREAMREGDILRGHADRKLAQAKEAPGFELTASRTFMLRERLAIEIRFRWRHASGVVDQTMVLVDPAHDRRRIVTIFNLTTLAAHAEPRRSAFWNMLQTARFGDAGPSTTRLPSPTTAPERSNDPSSFAFAPMPGHDHRWSGR